MYIVYGWKGMRKGVGGKEERGRQNGGSIRIWAAMLQAKQHTCRLTICLRLIKRVEFYVLVLFHE